MVAEIKKLIDLAANAVKSEDALRFSQAAANVAHALAAAPVEPMAQTTRTHADHMLTAPSDNMYAGFSREQASRRAQEVCRIAGETGQTISATRHLIMLFPMINGPYKGYVVVKWSNVAGAEHYLVRVKNLSTDSEFEAACTKGKVFKFAVDNPDHKFDIWVDAIGFDGKVIRHATGVTMSIHEGELT